MPPVQRPGFSIPNSFGNSLINSAGTNPFFNGNSLNQFIARLRDSYRAMQQNPGGQIYHPGGTMPANRVSGGPGDQFRQQAVGHTGQGMGPNPQNQQPYAPRPDSNYPSQSARSAIGSWGGPFAGALFNASAGGVSTPYSPANDLARQWLAALAQQQQNRTQPVATKWGFMTPQY